MSAFDPLVTSSPSSCPPQDSVAEPLNLRKRIRTACTRCKNRKQKVCDFGNLFYAYAFPVRVIFFSRLCLDLSVAEIRFSAMRLCLSAQIACELVQIVTRPMLQNRLLLQLRT